MLRAKFDRLKSFYNRNQTEINKHLEVAGKCVKLLAPLHKKENQNALNYASIVLDLKQTVQQLDKPIDIEKLGFPHFCYLYAAFNNCAEKYFLHLFENQYKIVKNSSSRVIYCADGPTPFAIKYPIDAKAAATSSNDMESQKDVFVSCDTEPLLNRMSEFFWNFYENCVSVNVNTSQSSPRPFFKSIKLDNCIESAASNKLVAKLEKYKNQDIGRSILLYGRPGTGKSNLARCVGKHFGNILIFSLERFEDWSNLIFDCLKIKPKVIILEDIDHCQITTSPDILKLFELINKQNIIVIATANEVKFNPAFIRAGRFDELIEVSHLEEEVVRNLTNHDPELFELTKHFPASTIVEIMKRIKAEGREIALASLNDLTKRLE